VNRLRHSRRGVTVEVGQCHLVPGLREGAHDSGTDAGGGAGNYYCHLAQTFRLIRVVGR
jgi:hypothetical protein